MKMIMNKRRAFIASVAVAAVASGLVAAWLVAGAAGARTFSATTVTQTFTVPGTSQQFAPPPVDATPALTAAQAWSDFAGTAVLGTDITPDMTAELGSFTDPIGPYCGAECDVWQTVNGISYRAYNELAYGFYWSTCPSDSTLPATSCQNWFFVDANTGTMIIGALPSLGGGAAGVPAAPSPSASAGG